MSDYSVFDTGDLDAWADREDGILPEARMPGRLFVERELDLAYFGVTVNSREPGEGAHFWHDHTHLEELYLFLSGTGVMGLGDDIVQVRAGTAVRVGPGVMRTWRAAKDSTEPLRWVCIRGGGTRLAESPDQPSRDFDRSQPSA